MSISQTAPSHRPAAAAANPSALSHHAIMELAAPFRRRGYAVDLGATDRSRRSLAFRPIEVAAVPGQDGQSRCLMRLEQPHRALIRLTRTLEASDGRTATLTAEGDDPEALLDAVENVKAARQFHEVAGVMLVRDYWISRWSAASPGRLPAGYVPGLPRLTKVETSIGGIGLSGADEGRRAFEIRLTTDEDRRLDLTEDLLAVLGWNWRPLRMNDKGDWWGSVKPPARDPRRTARLEEMLDTAVTHLVETLPRIPAQFHWRYHGARWRAAFQRLLPLLITSTLVVAFFALTFLLPKSVLSHMFLLYMSILGIVAMSLLDKSYRLEIPPIPRPLAQSRWWSPATLTSAGEGT